MKISTPSGLHYFLITTIQGRWQRLRALSASGGTFLLFGIVVKELRETGIGLRILFV
jgi:hypothetical protein